MRVPAPSPTGRNTAGLFLTGAAARAVSPRAAYDAALSEASGAELFAFLQGKLSEEDLAAFCKMAGIDAGIGMDDPTPFKGMPQTGGGKFGMDAASKDFARRFPHAARIVVNR